MAEEGLQLPVGPESSKPLVAYLRRNSTGRSVPPSGEEKVLPHYMRTSIGSCHDFCKFGKKHAIKEKVRLTFSKTSVAKPFNEQNASESLDITLRKVTSAVKSEKSSASRIHAHGTSASGIIKPEMTTKSHQIKSTRKDEVVMEKKVSLPRPRSLFNSKSYPPDAQRPLKQVQFEKVGVSSRNASPKAKEAVSLSGEHSTALSKLKSVTEKKSSSTAPLEALRAKKTIRASEPSAEKRAVNAKVSLRKTTSSPRATLALKQSIGRAARKLKSLKGVSTLKNQKKTSMDEEQPDIKEINKNEPEEKTLHVIKVEAEDQPFESYKNEDCAFECFPLLESTTKVCAIKMEDKVSELSVSHESPSLQTCKSLPSSSDVDGEDHEITESGASVSEDYEAPVTVRESYPLKGENRASEKESQTVALRFKQGKVVCVQSENNGARRLKFRRARTLEPNLNGKAEVSRRFRKREVGDDIINDERSGGEKVVLKHQDVQGKKDTQGLFNNVIEETASKLVESRKSMVKALVGAFETVISLQDGKPSETAVS